MFFTVLENAHPVGAACRAAGYTIPSVYRWRTGDAAFAKRWADALSLAGDLLEEEADRRGRDGYDMPVFFRGRNVGRKRRYSDTLLLARLKAIRPDAYREGRAAPPQPQKVPVIIREFQMEEEMIRLLAAGTLTLDDLQGWPRAHLERLLAERRDAALPAPDSEVAH